MPIMTWRQFLAEADASAPAERIADGRVAEAVHRLATADGFLLVASILAQAKSKTRTTEDFRESWRNAVWQVVFACDQAAESFLQDGELPSRGRLAPGDLAGEGDLRTAMTAELNAVGRLAQRASDQAQALMARTNARTTDLVPIRKNIRDAVTRIPQMDTRDMIAGMDGAHFLDVESGWRGLGQAMADWEGSESEEDVRNNAREAADIVAEGKPDAAARLLGKATEGWGGPFEGVDFGDDVWVPNFDMHPEAQRRYQQSFDRDQSGEDPLS